MILFWLIMVLMVVIAAAVVLRPLTSPPPATGTERRQINLDIVRERLAELEAEHHSGKLDEAAYRQLRTEVERTALSDLPDHEQTADTGGNWRWPAIAMVMILPLAGLYYYYQQGYQGEVAGWLQRLERHGERLEQAIYRPESIREVADGDLPGLIQVLQSRVLAQGKNDPDSLYALGIAYLEQDQPRPALVMLERLISIDPGYQEARVAYARGMLQLGGEAFRAGEYQVAIDAWQPLLALQPPDTPTYRMIQDGIAAARARLAGEAPPPAAPAPAGETVADTGARISVRVDLDPQLASRITPTDTLYVFARAAEGPRMPLVVERLQVGDFPVEVVLDENDAMTPSLSLADAGEVVVQARVSRVGDVIARPGDLEGISGAIDLAGGSRSVDLLIDQVVP